MTPSSGEIGAASKQASFTEEHYRELHRKTIVRLLLMYMLPLVLLFIYFFIQYEIIVNESERLHLKAIAENQANTLNLFLIERVSNLSNLIDDPAVHSTPDSDKLKRILLNLQRTSRTFVDIGYFGPGGVQDAYAGPYPSLEQRNYSNEEWYRTLRDTDTSFIITDIYLGFRQKPHFTIAVSRFINGKFIVLRATLDPARFYEYISTLEGSQEAYTSIVNKEGFYQIVTPHLGSPLQEAAIVPPESPHLGIEEIEVNGSRITYAYSWLQEARWALIIEEISTAKGGIFSGHRLRVIAISLLAFLLTLSIILHRSKKVVQMQMETDSARAQLGQAAKLASLGELAAGIAHEINNPLAVITEQAGLIKDMMNPEFGYTITPEELLEYLDNIQESAFRCRDITRKLLGFVRKTEFELKLHNIHTLIDSVVDGLLGPELIVENIKIVRDYDDAVPMIETDGNQLQQVFLNIIKNGIDAIGEKPGRIELSTRLAQKMIRISISDDGKGMTPAQLEKIFMPFFTTKEVGKGTGLGLSVSYGIIKNLGGTIEVKSVFGQGSTFIISLPA